jgi:cytochrome c
MMNVAACLAVAVLAAGASVAQAQSGEDLIKKSGCVACHANDKKVVGPA